VEMDFAVYQRTLINSVSNNDGIDIIFAACDTQRRLIGGN
jgi:hypothetical protein